MESKSIQVLPVNRTRGMSHPHAICSSWFQSPRLPCICGSENTGKSQAQTAPLSSASRDGYATRLEMCGGMAVIRTCYGVLLLYTIYHCIRISISTCAQKPAGSIDTHGFSGTSFKIWCGPVVQRHKELMRLGDGRNMVVGSKRMTRSMIAEHCGQSF
jgi:hypothetical protein